MYKIGVFSQKNISFYITERIHNKEITSFRYSKEFEFIITTSKDSTSKIINPKDLKIIKEFNAQRPLNTAAISSLMYSEDESKK